MNRNQLTDWLHCLEGGMYDWVIDEIRKELAKPANEFYPDWDMMKPFHDRIAELEQQLAKPEQAPVAWIGDANYVEGQFVEGRVRRVWWECNTGVGQPLYTAPPQTEKQEPVAYVTGYHNGRCVITPLNPALLMPSGMALYIAPPRKPKQEPQKNRLYKSVWEGL